MGNGSGQEASRVGSWISIVTCRRESFADDLDAQPSLVICRQALLFGSNESQLAAASIYNFPIIYALYVFSEGGRVKILLA